MSRILIGGQEDGMVCLAEPTAWAKVQMCMTSSRQLGTSVRSMRKARDKEFVCGGLCIIIILIRATVP